MRAPESIRRVFKKFDGIALETLTKAWRYPQQPETYQRTVPLIKEQHEKYNTTGNCFDLSLWLYESFQHEGVSTYFIGESMGTPDAHVAVLAQDEKGFNYYCDLGDQWIEPILVDARSKAFTEEIQYGFFPGANISIKADEDQFQVTHHRPNGKKSTHTYSMNPVSYGVFMEAAEDSQTLFRAPLVETRFYNKDYDEVVHWEFNQGESFMSTTKGLIKDEPPENLEEQVERIYAKTGMDPTIIRDALTVYADEIKKGVEDMEQTLLEDFKGFLGEYRDSWNSLDAERMSSHNSKQFKAVWANPDSITSDWGYDEAREGWIQAYEQYQGKKPIWHFEDVLIDINNQEEGVVVCWVSFELDGEMTDVKLLFTQTFQKENGAWKKIREYVENSFTYTRQEIHTS